MAIGQRLRIIVGLLRGRSLTGEHERCEGLVDKKPSINPRTLEFRDLNSKILTLFKLIKHINL